MLALCSGSDSGAKTVTRTTFTCRKDYFSDFCKLKCYTPQYRWMLPLVRSPAAVIFEPSTRLYSPLDPGGRI